jgi:hypothetical protein
MRAVYQTIVQQLDALIVEAQLQGRRIGYIELTQDEMDELHRELDKLLHFVNTTDEPRPGVGSI